MINQVRLHRNTPNLELNTEGKDDKDIAQQVKDYITMEFMREVIGEGQLFFYYKRNAMTSVMSDACDGTKTTKTMDIGNYTWPMPKVEMDKRVTK